ncbi:MAG TPA: BatA domain-containing protein, partial [Verrucomicrobiales bacterium]|nr:BatA domain-containing protein [Verrucomicrobiales bacterium]
MSFLFPLYLLGAAALAVPILLHLRRRPPTEHLEFSSLMFLEKSPERMTRRTRLERWLLLALRCLALLLLAFAFGRPFLTS